MTSAIVTGGTSFIGLALVQKLLREKVHCYVIVRPNSNKVGDLPKENKFLHIILSDVKDVNAWISNIPKCDVFFHFAWDGVGAEGRSDFNIQQSNIKMSMDCLKAAQKLKCEKFIFSGSQSEYGSCNDLITEETDCAPLTEYGKAKFEFFRMASKMCQSINLKYIHLRIFSVYGYRDHPWTLVSRCIEAFSKGLEIKLSSCEQMWNYLYIDDAANAIFELSNSEKVNDNLFNIAGESTRPLKEYVEIIRTICNNNGFPKYGTRGKTIEKAYGILPDISRMKKVTGWKEHYRFEQGIKCILSKMGEIR